MHYTRVYLHVQWCRKIHGVHVGAIYNFQTRQTKVERVALFTLHPSHNNIQPVLPHSEECMLYGTFLKTIKIPGMFVVVFLKMHLYGYTSRLEGMIIQPCMQEEQLLYKGTVRE